MRIFFLLLIVFFIQNSYAEFLQEISPDPLKLHSHEYQYSIKNLPQAVKEYKKASKKNSHGDASAVVDRWNISNSNHQSNTDIIYNNNPELSYGSRYDSKGPTHREITDKQHEILRNKTLDFGTSPVIRPVNPEHINLDKLLKQKMIDKLLPSFKTRIDL